MNYSMTITPKGEYLLAELNGQNSLEVAQEGIPRLKAACEEHDCYRILILSRMASMEVLEAYQMPDLFRETGFTSQYKWAWVHLTVGEDEVPHFIETVLTNRGLLNGQVFLEIDKARAWLLDDPDIAGSVAR